MCERVEPRRPRARRMGMVIPIGVRLVLLICALGVATACSDGSTTPATRSPTESTSVHPRPSDTDEVLVGHRYEYDLYTHCGVQIMDLDGDLWEATRALGDGNIPPGWNQLQPGVIEVVSDDAAVFRDAAGHEVTFVRRAFHPEVGCA